MDVMESAAQVARQMARVASGQYAVMNVCEGCGAHVGMVYYSAHDCNETGWGVVLCEQCATAIERYQAHAHNGE